jgi:hypothetical protein
MVAAAGINPTALEARFALWCRRQDSNLYSLAEGDFKYSREGRRINLYLIRCPFPFTRVTRSALQSEEYGHPDGHLCWLALAAPVVLSMDMRLCVNFVPLCQHLIQQRA